MKSPTLKTAPASTMPRRRDERGAMLTAIGFGLGGGLLLASPVADYLSSPQVSERHQLVNPFSSWNSLSDADVVILGTDVGGGNTDVMYTMRVQNLSLIHISEPTRPLYISYAVFC